MNRTILHFDIDAFFASVEVLENPALLGRPVVVGGIGKRGVVATASYEARAFGIHSAMSTQTARRLCPQAIFISGKFEVYKKYSERVFSILSEFSPLYEKVSIDEAYVDLTAYEGDPRQLALELKERVKAETGLTISMGISYNKFLAKLASDWKKPNGFFEITEAEAYEFLSCLPVIKIHGLGKKSAEKLSQVGIYKVSELQKMPIEHLSYFLGHSWAEEIYQRIRGIDNRPLVTHYERKSYGKETTFIEDVTDPQVLRGVVDGYAYKILEALRNKDLSAQTVTIKAKYSDFQQITRSHSFDHGFNEYLAIRDTIGQLLTQLDPEKPVRLIGISFSNFTVKAAVQMNLFDSLMGAPEGS